MEGTSNNDIRFTIVDGDAMNNFLINEITGEISINVPLDFEAMNDTEEYRYCNLTVQAKDLGKPPQENNVSVIIYVQVWPN